MTGGLTYRQLGDIGAFQLLGELFPDPSSALNLLEDVGADPTRLPVFTSTTTPEGYWRSVCRSISQGMFAFGLDDLMSCAAGRFPHRPELARHTRGTMRIVCLLASPVDEARLRLEVEHRELLTVAARSSRPMELVVHPATRIADIIPMLIEATPTIVHFAGHGISGGELIFEDDAGRRAPVSVDTLARVFESVAELDFVFLNCCYSGRYANALLGSARAVIGSTAAIDDECALSFCRALYTAVGSGRDVPNAFEIARSQLELDRCPTSDVRLVTRDD